MPVPVSEKTTLDLEEEEWDRIMDLNLKSVFLRCKEVGKHTVERERGRIVNVASVAAYTGNRHSAWTK